MSRIAFRYLSLLLVIMVSAAGTAWAADCLTCNPEDECIVTHNTAFCKCKVILGAVNRCKVSGTICPANYGCDEWDGGLLYSRQSDGSPFAERFEDRLVRVDRAALRALVDRQLLLGVPLEMFLLDVDELPRKAERLSSALGYLYAEEIAGTFSKPAARGEPGVSVRYHAVLRRAGVDQATFEITITDKTPASGFLAYIEGFFRDRGLIGEATINGRSLAWDLTD